MSTYTVLWYASFARVRFPCTPCCRCYRLWPLPRPWQNGSIPPLVVSWGTLGWRRCGWLTWFPSRVHFFCLLRVSRISSSTLVDVMLARIKTLESLEPPPKWPNISGYFRYIPWCFPRNPNKPHWSCPLSISLAILASQEPKLRGDLWSLAAPTIGQCRGHSSPCLLLCHWAAVECIGGMVSGRQWGYHYLGQDAYQSSWFSRISLTLAFVLICSLWRYMLLTVCSTCFWGCCSIWQRVRQTPRFQCLLHCICRPQDFGFLLVSW